MASLEHNVEVYDRMLQKAVVAGDFEAASRHAAHIAAKHMFVHLSETFGTTTAREIAAAVPASSDSFNRSLSWEAAEVV